MIRNSATWTGAGRPRCTLFRAGPWTGSWQQCRRQSESNQPESLLRGDQPGPGPRRARHRRCQEALRTAGEERPESGSRRLMESPGGRTRGGVGPRTDRGAGRRPGRPHRSRARTELQPDTGTGVGINRGITSGAPFRDFRSSSQSSSSDGLESWGNGSGNRTRGGSLAWARNAIPSRKRLSIRKKKLLHMDLEL